MKEKDALGMIETKGLIGLIEATDAAVKAAKTIAVDYEKTGGGIVIIKLRGSVGAVKAAVEAGAAAAQRIGQLVASHVIPNPDDGIEPMIIPIEHPGTSKPARELHFPVKRTKLASNQMTVKVSADDEKLAAIANKIERDGIESLDYNELRYLARRTDGLPISKGDIRNLGRGQLLDIFRSARLKIER